MNIPGLSDESARRDTGPFAMSDVVRALQLAGGLDYANHFDQVRLDVVKGASSGGIDVSDAVRLARKVRNLEANP